MIYGYILIMVIMLPSGDIDSRAVDWFEDPYECVENDQYQHENHESPLGVGFVLHRRCPTTRKERDLDE